MNLLFQLVASLVLAFFIALAASQNSVEVNGVPLFGICAGVAFVVQWVIFIPSYIFQTEKFYDLTGSLTYLTIIGLGVTLSPADPQRLLLGVLVAIWACRLGLFLFMRIHKAGKDTRFDKKTNFMWFLFAWNTQGLWVVLTSAAALTCITSATSVPISWLTYLGLTVWILGFTVEVISDRQKSAFKAQPKNQGKFIQEGLWAYSRHPNYAGEIILWFGVAIIALPGLSGWQYCTLISPVFVYLLLRYGSGVPLLEKQGLKRWGDLQAYQEYIAKTPILFPWVSPPRQAKD